MYVFSEEMLSPRCSQASRPVDSRASLGRSGQALRHTDQGFLRIYAREVQCIRAGSLQVGQIISHSFLQHGVIHSGAVLERLLGFNA